MAARSVVVGEDLALDDWRSNVVKKSVVLFGSYSQSVATVAGLFRGRSPA